jgi:DNA-3-methyladenine glycosylase II
MTDSNRPEVATRSASSVNLKLAGPFDLPLSIEAAARFFPRTNAAPAVLKVATRVGPECGIFEIRQTNRTPPVVEASSTIPVRRSQLLGMARWLVSAELDLRPFYRIVAPHPIMGAIAKSLRGLKPLRPVSLFEMAIIAITEQQLSLAAAFHIRGRLIGFGTPLEGHWIFPTPAAPWEASLNDLRACGLSRRKAEYIRGIAESVANGTLDFDALKRETDTEVRAHLRGHRGFGDWSTKYFLVRGLERMDCLPSNDVSLRRVVGKYLARGRYLSPEQLEQALSPFTPFRGLAAFYLSVAARFKPASGAHRHDVERLLPGPMSADVHSITKL